MSIATGTATSYTDLLTRFNTFVTTGLGSQNWTKQKDGAEGPNDRVLYYRLPGLSGTDQIFVRLWSYHDTGADYYNIGIAGASGFNTGAPWDNQPNQSPFAYLLLWNTNIPYRFIANGRRAIIIARIGGVDQVAYLGFITPYASPSEWDYPLFIGAMHSERAKRYSSVDFTHRAFFNPAGDPGNITPGFNSGSYLCAPGKEWISFGNYSINSEDSNNATGNLIWPFCTTYEQVGQVYGGSSDYCLQPLVLHSTSQGKAVWGEFDGVRFVSGFGNASGNVITISSVQHVVVQSGYRSAGPDANNANKNQYAAMEYA